MTVDSPEALVAAALTALTLGSIGLNLLLWRRIRALDDWCQRMDTFARAVKRRLDPPREPPTTPIRPAGATAARRAGRHRP